MQENFMKTTQVNDFLEFQPDFCPVCSEELHYDYHEIDNSPDGRIYLFARHFPNIGCKYENYVKDNIHHEYFICKNFQIENYRTFREDYNPKKYSAMFRNYKIIAKFPDIIIEYKDTKKLDKLLLLI
jgi:hypothetical protein